MTAVENIPKYERLLNLVAYLLKSRAPVPWSKICGTVVGYDDDADTATIKRRFERDKDELRAMGVPVRFAPITEAHDEGYTIAREECFLPPLNITPEEALALSCISNLAGGKHADPMLGGVRSALLKLRAGAPEAFGEERPTALLLDTGKDSRRKERDNLSALRQAVLRRKTVRFRYRSLENKRAGVRTVNPYGMALFEGRWYLAGRSHERDALRVWNVERIAGAVRELEPASPGADFDPPRDFRVEEHIGLPGWLLYRGRKRTRAKIWFHPDVAWMIADSAKAATGKERESFTFRGDGSGILEIFKADPEALVLWTLKFKEKARILEPRGLRALALKVLSGIRDSL
jgi:predicted DNA-binding transcriptional regulator YafY